MDSCKKLSYRMSFLSMWCDYLGYRALTYQADNSWPSVSLGFLMWNTRSDPIWAFSFSFGMLKLPLSQVLSNLKTPTPFSNVMSSCAHIHRTTEMEVVFAVCAVVFPQHGLSVWSLHVLLVYAWVLSRHSGFVQQSKNMHVRLIDVFKLFLGVSVNVNGCLSLCGPVMDWWPVKGVHHLPPNHSCAGFQAPQDGWMDGVAVKIPLNANVKA